ncbi:MAG: homoserine dehydrogenase, partial [Candidatus Eremiobacteraeota bacterium]|nr:homoserine dehydrogenase [Candidatus Eremiobacteraeota bacterium]
AHKLAIIAQTAFGARLLSPQIPTNGIRGITQADVANARSQGLRIRLVAGVERTAQGVRASVGPLVLPKDHEFARTQGVENVVQIDARDAGQLTLRGEGAGGSATASSVLGDIVAVLRRLAPAASILATA